MIEHVYDLVSVRTLHAVNAYPWLRKAASAFWCEWNHVNERPQDFAKIIAELESLNWPRHIRPGSTVVDIGGHSGDTAIPMGLFAYDREKSRPGKVIVVEPNPEVLKVMAINLALNAHVADFHIVPCAITKNDVAEIELADHDNLHNNGGIVESISYSESLNQRIASIAKHRYKARGITIETMLKECGVANFSEVSFIKTDCEGYDKEILRSSADFLREFKPILFVEWFGWFSPEDDADLFDAIREAGYTAVNPRSMGKASVTDRLSDLLCLPIS